VSGGRHSGNRAIGQAAAGADGGFVEPRGVGPHPNPLPEGEGTRERKLIFEDSLLISNSKLET
jgi:hypothetical protein